MLCNQVYENKVLIKYTCRAGILPQKEKGFQQIYSCKCMHTWINIGM